MPSTSVLRRVPLLAALSVVAAALPVLSGCGEALPPAPQAYDFIHQGSQTPALVVQYCVDRTGSYYPSDDFTSANTYVAQSLMQRASQPGQGSTFLYVTLIGANTYAEDATKEFTVPATVPTATFVPDQSQGNMFEAATPTAAARAAQATVTAEQAQAQQQVQQAKAAATQASGYLTSLAPDTDDATDINGCFQAAQDHFAHAPQGAQKVIVVASDLQDTVAGKPVSFSLTGVKVLVINFRCDEAAVCDSGTKPTWHDALMHGGATSVQFFDPADTHAQFASGGLFS